MTKPALLCVSGASCGYGSRTILRDLDFTIDEGQVLGIVGDNAAGKTTLFRALSGRDAWMQGTVEWRGLRVADLRSPPVPLTAVAWLLQDRPVFASLTVRQALHAVFRGGKTLTLESALSDLDAVLPLDDALLGRAMQHLSGGEKALASLALCLVNQPELLLLDEPAAGLSSETQEHVRRVLGDLTRRGLACLIIEHRSHFIESLAGDRLCLSRKGGQV